MSLQPLSPREQADRLSIVGGPRKMRQIMGAFEAFEPRPRSVLRFWIQPPGQQGQQMVVGFFDTIQYVRRTVVSLEGEFRYAYGSDRNILRRARIERYNFAHRRGSFFWLVTESRRAKTANDDSGSVPQN